MGKGQRTFKCDQHHSHSTAKARLRCMRLRGVDPFKSKNKKKLADKFRSIIRKTINSYRYICNIEKSPHFTHFFDQKQIKTLLIHWFISTFIPTHLPHSYHTITNNGIPLLPHPVRKPPSLLDTCKPTAGRATNEVNRNIREYSIKIWLP